MMKLAICVAVVLISIVSGLGLLARRDADPEYGCRNAYGQIKMIMQPPNFGYLFLDGEMNLDCSEETLTKADECQNASVVLCRTQFSTTQLYGALNVFCQHITDVEAEPACWASDNLQPAMVPCYGKDRHDMALCAEENVANLTECTATAGAIIHELILIVVD